jgi:two-component system nitrogen regulation sensor histidine kinase NtrY
MKLKIKFISFVVVLHVACLVMSYFIFREHPLVFISVEILLLLTAVISIHLYKQLIKPLGYLKNGINAIKDQDFNVKFLPTGQTEVDELVAVYNKMIDELRNERTRQQEQHFFLEKLIQTSPTGIIVLDFDAEIKQINPTAAEILNVNGNTEQLLQQLMAIQTNTSKIIKIDELRSYKVQKSRFIDRGFERVFFLLEEVTEEIFKAEKNVYSKVIRMMAHEVNNTVGPVNSIMQLALQQNKKSDEQHLALQNALQVAIDRNQNLNIFMRNFADLVKLPLPNKKRLDVVAQVEAVTTLLQHVAEELKIELKLEMPDAPYFINADAQQMEQALINIVKNAMEAASPNGIVKLRLAEHQLTVTDNGKGIDEDDAAQLFTPFFSTKKDGQGIGLTLVREILVNHGYEFSLKTLSPGITVFSVSFRI